MNLNLYKSPWKYFVKAIPVLGGIQEYLKVGSIDDITSRFVLDKNSEFYFINHLSKQEWKDRIWLEWPNENHEKKVELFFLMDKIESKETIGKLIKTGVINARLVKDSLEGNFTGGFALSTSPEKIWFEGDHSKKKGKAYECYFSPEPYKKVWRSIKSSIDEIWRVAVPLSVQSDLFLEER